MAFAKRPRPTRSRLARRVGIGAAAAAGLVVLAFAGVALLDDAVIRPAAVRALSEATGREVSMEHLQIQPFSLTPRVRVGGVAVGNADWAAAEHLATLEDGELAISLPSLLLGRLVLTELRLQRPELYLERADDGRVNWRFAEEPEGPQRRRSLPAVHAVTVEHGFGELRDGAARSLLEFEVRHAGDDAELPVTASAKGRWRGAPLAMEARAGAVRELVARSRPYPLKVDVASGRATFSYDGEMRPFDAGQPLSGRITAAGGDLWDLRDLAGMPLPHTRPYELSAQLARRADGWHVTDLEGRMGKSDIRGSFSLTQREERPFIFARLQSKLLDVADLGGLLGGTPGNPKPPTKPGSVVPDKPFEVRKLARFDADIALEAGTLRQTADLPLDRLDTRVVMDRGRISVDPLHFGVAKGRIDAIARADVNASPMAAATELSFKRLHLAELLPRTGGTAAGMGTIDGRARLSGRGAAADELLASLDGEIGFVTRGGEMSNLLLEIAGLDAGEAVRFLVGGDRRVPIRCGIASFTARDGVVKSEALLLDTEDTKVTGEVHVDLGEQQMRVDLYPQPKDPSIAVLRAPLHIKGTFAKPAVSIDKKALAARAGAALLLGMVNPLLAVIPLVETGGAEDANCGALVAEVEKNKAVGRSPRQ